MPKTTSGENHAKSKGQCDYPTESSPVGPECDPHPVTPDQLPRAPTPRCSGQNRLHPLKSSATVNPSPSQFPLV